MRAIVGLDCAISPDGKRVVANAKDGSLWLLNADLTDAKLLVDARTNTPRFSPDGNVIYYVFDDTDLFSIDLNGENRKPLATNVKVMEYTVSPDGKQILASGLTTEAFTTIFGIPVRALGTGNTTVSTPAPQP